MQQGPNRGDQAIWDEQVGYGDIGRTGAPHTDRVPGIVDRRGGARKEYEHGRRLPGLAIGFRLASSHLDRRHRQPPGILTPAGEWHSSGDPPAAVRSDRRGGC